MDKKTFVKKAEDFYDIAIKKGIKEENLDNVLYELENTIPDQKSCQQVKEKLAKITGKDKKDIRQTKFLDTVQYEIKPFGEDGPRVFFELNVQYPIELPNCNRESLTHEMGGDESVK